MAIPASIRRPLWRLYGLTGPFQAAVLCASLIRRHGLVNGISRYRRLPPGGLGPVDQRLRLDQRYLLRRADRLGPIFKNKLRHGLLISVVGNAAARRLVADNENRLESRHKDLSALFPIGHLRSMQGEAHRHYRALFVRALRPELLAACDEDLRAVTEAGLSELSAAAGDGTVSTDQMIEALRAITTRMLLRLFLGVSPSDPMSARLLSAYARLAAGYAPAYTYSGSNPAYQEIRAFVLERIGEEAERAPEYRPDCVLRRLVQDGQPDDTAIGNLIYMVESGRFDLFSLFRWILYYLTLNPERVAAVRAAADSNGGRATAPALACVLETLRSNQSEAIQRVLTEDVTFEGYFLPAGSQLRFCLWEAHKNPETFSRPFDFNPDRFQAQEYPLTQFAPFGLDKHRCVASDYVVALGKIFVESLTGGYELQRSSQGEPVWGAYHWEPGPDFSLRITPLRQVAAAGSPS